MIFSQFVFLIILIIFLFYSYKVKNILINRMVFLLLGMAGIFLILFPNITSRIANFMGIGRGTDLVVYLFILISLFLFVYVMSILKRLEQKITAVVRYNAIDNPRQTLRDEFLNK